MVTLTLQFRSNVLRENQTMNVVLPDGVPASEMKVLTLLHGMHGNYNDWMKNTGVARIASHRKVALVMPTAQNSFYHNMKVGGAYEDYVTGEVPEFVNRVFGLSMEREKNYIAGLSMGGYGAFYLALSHPDKYCASASLSGCLDIAEVAMRRLDNGDEWNQQLFRAIFGDLKTSDGLYGTDSDLKVLIDRLKDSDQKPKLFSCIGTEDYLYAPNTDFRDFMKGYPQFDYAYGEGPGVHSWDFWDHWIGDAMEKIGLV